MTTKAFRDPGLQALFEENLVTPPGWGGTASAPPSQFYMICATPRCGSNMLCEGLKLTQIAGVPEEYFEAQYREVLGHVLAAAPRSSTAALGDGPDASGGDPAAETRPLMPFKEYLESVLKLRTGPNGAFGMKVMWNDLGTLTRELAATIGCHQGLPSSEVLAQAFPNLRYIYISRSDKVRQAISLAKAVRSERWVSFLPSQIREENLAYDFDEIASYRSMLVAQDRAWESFFESAGIHPHRIVYEQFVETYEQTVRNVLAFVGLGSPNPRRFRWRGLSRMATTLNDEWYERFVRDARRASWGLETHEGSAAFLEHVSNDGERMRVTIARSSSDIPWCVKLKRAPVELIGSERYLLAFRARADAPRRIGWAVGLAATPWDNLCRYADLEVTTDWQAFEWPFVAAASESNARIFFDLGGNNSAVEFSDVVLRELSTGRDVMLPAAV